MFSYKSKYEDNANHTHDNSQRHSHGSADSIGDSEIVDIENRQSTRISLDRNIFCGGACFLDDGQIFVAGGQYPTFYALIDSPCKDIHTFSPNGYQWRQLSKQNSELKMKGRWYPSCLTLSDGKVMIISGRYSFYQIHFGIFRFIDNTFQIFNPDDNTLSKPSQLPFKIDLYPFVHLLPSGKVFVHSNNVTRIFDPSRKSWETASDGKVLTIKTNYKYSRTNPGQGTSVMLPLSPKTDPPYRTRILIIGGVGSNSLNKETEATKTAEVLDFGEVNIEWANVKPMHHARVMPDAVLLPDGNVFVVNGSKKGKSDLADDSVMEPELYNIERNEWHILPKMSISRLYHAMALLLHDGSVLTTGTDKEWNKGVSLKKDQLNLEVFKPWYFFASPRPEISGSPDKITYKEKFNIRFHYNKDVESAVIIRPSTVTHSLNTEQKLVELEILSKTFEEIEVVAPPNGNIAPPGYYILFIMNKDNIPSKGKFIRISSNITI